MSTNFLLQNRDEQVLDCYLKLLAQRQIELEKTNLDLNERVKASDQIFVENKRLKHEIEKLKPKITQIPKIQLTENRNEQFIVRDDGTAIDTTTGLMWCRFSIGQFWKNGGVLYESIKMDFVQAQKRATSFSFRGFRDWRLPTLSELESIVERGNTSPAINQAVFPNTPDNWFLTSTRHKISNYQSCVYFGTGVTTHWHIDNANGHIRLVRDI